MQRKDIIWFFGGRNSFEFRAVRCKGDGQKTEDGRQKGSSGDIHDKYCQEKNNTPLTSNINSLLGIKIFL